MIARVSSDIPNFSESLSAAIPGISLNIMALIIFSGVLIYLSWQLALVVFATLPFYNISINTFNKKLKKLSKLEREKNSKVMEGIRESIEGTLTIKRFNKSNYFIEALKSYINDWIKASNKHNLFIQSIEDFITFIRGICPIIVLSFGGYLVMKGDITLGTLIGFYSFMNWIYEPVRVISHFFISLQSTIPVFKRIKEIHEMEEETSGLELLNKVKNIEYRNVYFSYDSIPILEGLNLKIRSNERIAIVGESGSGKTTVIKLVMRYFNVDKGNILVNGKSIVEYSLHDLRRKIIVVHQNDFLFNMSIRENILLGEKFSEKEFTNAIKVACIDKFINELGKGYDTIVGERGTRLSDGQKQRIAIARAVIRKPDVLILDEATSGIDSQTEAEIFKNLQNLNITVIIISHRLSTIKKADRIIVLHKGRVICEGNHENLLKNCRKYNDIIRNQLIVV
ncbi:ABC transporter ATP-binding protein [Thermosipho ferrireducens]|uniref:ABC transporter ATP-binding protein n=1 Tax=Thermosipho ferrireducens TaxID=2571116 RepID=A0ABX7S9M4_9BACT|nr:ABC transporter ATP-binding protein [Thermosipho ferrireducens]QTA37920.1 ABC transporter ATP-binding protein [Thermosipho ferrireducens]